MYRKLLNYWIQSNAKACKRGKIGGRFKCSNQNFDLKVEENIPKIEIQ